MKKTITTVLGLVLLVGCKTQTVTEPSSKVEKYSVRKDKDQEIGRAHV